MREGGAVILLLGVVLVFVILMLIFGDNIMTDNEQKAWEAGYRCGIEGTVDHVKAWQLGYHKGIECAAGYVKDAGIGWLADELYSHARLFNAPTETSSTPPQAPQPPKATIAEDRENLTLAEMVAEWHRCSIERPR